MAGDHSVYAHLPQRTLRSASRIRYARINNGNREPPIRGYRDVVGILRQLGSTSGCGLGLVNLHLRRRHLSGDSIGGGLCILGRKQGVADLCADGIEFRTELGMIQISSECHPAGLPGISELVDPDLDLFAILPEPRVTQLGLGGLDAAVVVGVLPIRTSQREPVRIRG